MAAGFSLFGREKETKASSETEARTTSTRASEEEARKTETQRGTTAQESRTVDEQTAESTRRLLSERSFAGLEGFLEELLGNAGASGAAGVVNPATASAEFAQLLAERSLGTQEFVDERTAGILSDARRQGELALGQNVSLAKERVGGGQNSLAALTEAFGTAELESRLGGLEGELALSGRQLEDAAAATAAKALAQSTVAGSSDVANIAAIANVLRGATETTQQQQTGTKAATATEETELETLSEILRLLSETQTGTSESKTFGKQTSSQGGNLLDIVGLFF